MMSELVEDGDEIVAIRVIELDEGGESVVLGVKEPFADDRTA